MSTSAQLVHTCVIILAINFTRNTWKHHKHLPRNDSEGVIHTFVTSRLDYSNSLFTGLDRSALHHLQVVQNAATRLLTGQKRRDHMRPTLAALDWLPIIKVLLIVFKCLKWSGTMTYD